jgi:hypothetical protein
MSLQKSAILMFCDAIPAFTEMEFLNDILVKVSGHKLESSQARVFLCFSTLIGSSFLVSRTFCMNF